MAAPVIGPIATFERPLATLERRALSETPVWTMTTAEANPPTIPAPDRPRRIAAGPVIAPAFTAAPSPEPGG